MCNYNKRVFSTDWGKMIKVHVNNSEELGIFLTVVFEKFQMR